MSSERTPAQHEWLRKRVRVGAGCAPEVTLAEGVVIAYAHAPTITVRDEQGRDSTWQVTLPIGVLGEVPDDELPASACGGRTVDTTPEGFCTCEPGLPMRDCGMAEHREVARLLRQPAQAEPVNPEEGLDRILRAAGVEYPLGLRGVRDLVNQRDGHRERAQEAEAELVELRAMRDRLEAKRNSLGLDAHGYGRELRWLDEIAGDR